MTLLELLVAMVLLALMATLMMGGIRFGVRAWEVSDTRIEDDTRIQAVQALLRRQLNGAAPTLRAGARGIGKIEFVGRAGEIRFVTTLPAHLAPGGASLVALDGKVDGGTRALVMRWRPQNTGFQDRDTEDDWAEERVLIADVADLEFAYFGAEKPGDEPQWSDEWVDRRTLPLLVRLRLSFEAGDRRSWPDLVADLPTRVRSP